MNIDSKEWERRVYQCAKAGAKHDFGNGKQLRVAVEYMLGRLGMLEHRGKNNWLRHKCAAERMEFMGDRLLGLSASLLLQDRAHSKAVGEWASLYNAMVCTETCFQIAADLMELTPEETARLDAQKKVVADGVECIIAALYDTAGWSFTNQTLQRLWLPVLEDMLQADEGDSQPHIHPRYSRANQGSAKSALQELAQSVGQPPVVYDTRRAGGADHEPVFVSYVTVESGEAATARGRTRKQAEAAAAAKLLQRLLDGSRS